MANPLRKPPAVSENQDFRAREYFDQDLFSMFTLVGTVTVTVGSILAGAIGTVSIPVPGARADQGHTVQVGLPSNIDTGLVPWGYVSASDMVVLVLYNRTGSPIVVPEATYSVRIMP